MKRVGTVSRVAQGVAIVRLDDDPPEIGTAVLDDSLSTVGRIVDVFGPVDRPYVAVSPASGVTPASLVGSKLYAR
ncbi:Gar1/Naf1 family protein [Salinigranum marinum]|uniref:H/ACA ribonucleoprotein complex subunit GAR1 n=1 Tax=Salinigranum marinum TaxID=1515595 RepID=UPI002989C83B|nr:Gar1/Naf1 family protein [Salinigranum marinum]